MSLKRTPVSRERSIVKLGQLPSPSLDSSDLTELLAMTAGYAGEFLQGVDAMPVMPTQEMRDSLAAFDVPLPQHGLDARDVIDELHRLGSPAAVTSVGRRFFGFVIGGSLPAALAADWMTSTWDQNSGADVISPVGIKLELIAARWLIELFGLPSESRGVFVTGATMGSFACLAAARTHLLTKLGWDVEEKGLFGAPEITVVTSEESHSSVGKALAMLGLGRSRVFAVPTDNDGAMIADQVPVFAGPAIYCLQAGNVNTGSCDPIAPILARINREHSWVHVDGAFGLWAAVSPSYRHLVEGLADADSWAVDGHKWLNVPYDNGVAIVRYPESLNRAFATSAAYLMDDRHDNLVAFFTPELSRRARGITVYAVLKNLGKSGVVDLIDRNCRLAKLFADEMAKRGHPILNRVVLNQVLIALPRDRVDAIQDAVDQCGVFWSSHTVWKDQAAMRISVSGWHTTDEDIRRSAEALHEIIGEPA